MSNKQKVPNTTIFTTVGSTRVNYSSLSSYLPYFLLLKLTMHFYGALLESYSIEID